jgi:hypothetical protein
MKQQCDWLEGQLQERTTGMQTAREAASRSTINLQQELQSAQRAQQVAEEENARLKQSQQTLTSQLQVC